ncbi:hypothetical protein [Thermogemmatispora carboxidivorans]|uniref:hypothetical protein n=1 Tax=Thermogemmatispora carboxidivorans TaxID=1382306 RepID=UPI0012DC98D4|nr:hypothetical protein [Thermogemmatispora carboxidivorans]
MKSKVNGDKISRRVAIKAIGVGAAAGSLGGLAAGELINPQLDGVRDIAKKLSSDLALLQSQLGPDVKKAGVSDAFVAVSEDVGALQEVLNGAPSPTPKPRSSSKTR